MFKKSKYLYLVLPFPLGETELYSLAVEFVFLIYVINKFLNIRSLFLSH